MMQTDPHGLTLTIISVSVVFAALIVLYFIYSFSGKLFSGELKASAKKMKRVMPGTDRESPEIAAAIALALDMESAGDEYVFMQSYSFSGRNREKTVPRLSWMTRFASPS